MERDVAQGGSFEPDMPLHMVWLATNACTARCLHCSSNSAKRGRGELTTAEVCSLIEQFTDAGVVDLGISGGEPMIRRDLFEIIAFAKSQGLSVGLATNGAKLSDAHARQLFELNLDRLQVSLDGFADEHDRLRQWPGLFQRVLKTITTARAAGLRVHVCCTITSFNVEQLASFVEFISTLNVQRINLSRYVPTGRSTLGLDLPDDRWPSVIRECADLKRRWKHRIEIVSHLAQQILVDDEVANMPAHIGCQAGRGQGCVTADGTVLPCVLLPLRLGNIRQAPFEQIWRSSTVIRTLQDRSNLEGRCGVCSLRARCGGCRAVALAKSGNHLGDDPRCWIGDGYSTCSVQ